MLRKKWNRVAVVALVFGLALCLHAYSTGTQDTAAAAQETLEVTAMIASVNFEFSEEMIAKDRVKKHLEERFNFKLNLRSFLGSKNEFGEMIIRQMAAGNAADLINVGVRWFIDELTWREWIEDELVIDLGEYVYGDPDRYSTLKKAFDHPMYKLLNDFWNADPDKYTAWFSPAFSQRANGGVTFNGYMLEEMGLEVPQTYDEFIAALRKAKQDLGVYGFGWVSYNATSWNYVGYNFFNPFGTEITGLFEGEDGWYDATIDPRNRERWRELQGYMAEGLLDPNWIENGYDCLSVDMLGDKCLAVEYAAPGAGQYAWAFGLFQKTHPDAIPEKHFVMPPQPLRGPGGNSTHNHTPFGNSWQWIVPYTTPEPDRIIDFMNFLASDEWQVMFNYGVKGIHYTKDDLSDFNEEEFLSDTLIWFPNETTRSQYPWFRWFVNGNQFYSPWEKYGDWIEGLKAATGNYPYQQRHATSPAYVYGKSVETTYLAESTVNRPVYFSFLSWSDEEVQIRNKLNDVRNKWFTMFLTGQEDLDTGWDNFVREYKATGSDQIVAVYSKKVSEAKAFYEKYVN